MVVEVPIFDVILTLFEEAMFHGVFVSGNKESSAAVKWSFKKEYDSYLVLFIINKNDDVKQ